MSSLAPRTLVIVAVAAGLMVAGVVAVSSLAAARSRPGRPHLTESRIVQIAERAAAAAGDRTPTLIQHSEGTRQRANEIASGDRVPGKRWSYLIAERGSFVLKSVSPPPGARPPRGSVLTLVVDAVTGTVSDFGVSNQYPNLAALGAVTTDLRQLPPGCLQKAPTRLPAELWPPARIRLAPRGASSIELCRYSGLNAWPPLTLDRMRLLRAAHLIAGLVGQLDRLPAPPSGATACPADDASQIVALLAYPHGRTVPVSVGLTGCRSVTNGTVQRTASGFGTPPTFGPQLVRHLQHLLNNGGRTPIEPILVHLGH
jgi:hypothetical protein